MRRFKNGFVYFLKPVGLDGPIKIGWSKSPLSRLETYMAWSPFPLELLATAPADLKHEYQVQRCFADAHSHREWFKPDQRLTCLIEKIAKGIPLADAIDLDKPTGVLPKRRRRKRTPEYKKYLSYAAKIRWRYRQHPDLTSPDDVDEIISRWYRRIQPSVDELARLDQVIADPKTHGVPLRVWEPEVRLPSWQRNAA